MTAQITEKALLNLFSKNRIIKENEPITVQVTNIKAIPNDQGKRLRLILSDGYFTVHGVMRPEFVDAAELQGLKRTSIITLNQYEGERMSNNRRVLLISEIKVIEESAPRYGTQSPSNVDEYFNQHPEEDLYAEAATAAVNKVESPAPQQQATYSKPKETHANLYAIDQLSPYQNNWTIKARVSYKSDVRTWSNQRGEGKLFNINLLDETNEIRATAFNDVVDKFYDLLQEGKVYYVSKARIQQSKPQFSNLSHPYELQLDRDTEIEECADAVDVPKLHFDFVKLNKVQDLEPNAIIDVVGVLKEVNPPFQIVAKATGRPFDRRDVVVVDESQFAISIGLWGKQALDFSLPEGTIMAVKGAKVTDFQGRALSLVQSATVVPNPDIPEAFLLKGWYDKQGIHEQFKSLKVEAGQSGGNAINLKERKTILDVQNENLGMNDKPDYFSVKGTINFIRTESFSYPSCQTEGCTKKVIEQPDGTWRCEKHDKNYESPKHRYLITLSVVDLTGQLWMTLFNPEVEKLLNGITADEIYSSGKNSATYFQSLQMKEFNWRVRAQQNNFNGTTRVRYQCAGVDKIDYNEEINVLSEKLNAILP